MNSLRTCVSMDSDSRILVAGSNGLVGSAIVRCLKSKGHNFVIESTRSEVDFTNQVQTQAYFGSVEPEYVFVAAAKVGGIMANKTLPADFIYQNLMIQSNIINSAYEYGCKKLVFLGSSCIYPKHPQIPITEDQLMTGPLEPTNDAYAVAKIAGIKMCQAYRQQHGFDAISLQPTNLYGVKDNFDPLSSHVIPGIMRRMHEAKLNGDTEFWCWGDGSPLREFLYIDDMAEACYACMENYSDSEIINIGTGYDISIKELTEVIAEVVGYNGYIKWDTTKPNGTPRKVMNVDKLLGLGWKPKVDIVEGLTKTYEWFRENYDRI
jgi:GDP-L-fucose synthase